MEKKCRNYTKKREKEERAVALPLTEICVCMCVAPEAVAEPTPHVNHRPRKRGEKRKRMGGGEWSRDTSSLIIARSSVDSCQNVLVESTAVRWELFDDFLFGHFVGKVFSNITANCIQLQPHPNHKDPPKDHLVVLTVGEGPVNTPVVKESLIHVLERIGVFVDTWGG